MRKIEQQDTRIINLLGGSPNCNQRQYLHLEGPGSLKEPGSLSAVEFSVGDPATPQFQVHVEQPVPDNASVAHFHVQVIYNILHTSKTIGT